MKTLKHLRNHLFQLTHQGTACHCVYCHKTYRKFMHQGVKSVVFKKYQVAGGGYKKNARCPHCSSSDRSRLLFLFFNLRTDVFRRHTKILHISPNYHVGNLLSSNNHVDYTCGALEPEYFAHFNAIKLDVTSIDLEDKQFDIVICNHVLEHVADDMSALREIFRILKPGGIRHFAGSIGVKSENNTRRPDNQAT